MSIGRKADVETAKASAEYRTKQVNRLKELDARGAIEHRLVNEEEQRSTEGAHDAEREAEAAVKSARRARLEAAEANLKAVEAEAGGTGPGTEPTSLRTSATLSDTFNKSPT